MPCDKHERLSRDRRDQCNNEGGTRTSEPYEYRLTSEPGDD